MTEKINILNAYAFKDIYHGGGIAFNFYFCTDCLESNGLLRIDVHFTVHRLPQTDALKRAVC